MSVTVFSRPGCVPCTRVKSWFDTKGIEYEERNVYEDEEALNTITNLGYSGVPVILAGDQHWSGINLEKMKELA